MCKFQNIVKKSLAEQAIELPIFAAFRFCWVNYARLKEKPNGNLVVSFADDSYFIMTKNGDMFLSFLVFPKNPYSTKPSSWFLAKNAIQAISLYKKDVEIYGEVEAALLF